MSVTTEITRLKNAKADIKAYITGKGVIVPDGTKLDGMAALIEQITTDNTKVYAFDQRRPEVADFLDNVTYDPSDYTTSQIANYITERTQNIPVPASVDVNQSGTLVIADEGSKIVYSKAIESGTQSIYNVIPNSETPFNIIANGKIAQSGIIKLTGACRMVNVPTINNMRDLGGWACDGGTVKYGKIYRGGMLQEGAYDVFVNQLGIRHDLCLRGTSEAASEPDPSWEEVGYTCPEKYVWYNLTDKTTWKEILNCIFDSVIDGKPIFFHCSAGADRTGTVACVIEALLGVAQSDLDKDYELTCFSSGVATDALARRRNESEWQGLINAINAYDGDSFMYKAIDFVKSCDIPVARINAFRKSMINGTPEIIAETSYTVTKNATSCTISGNDSAVKGSTYTATVTAEEGYNLEVTITMGGSDVSSCYADGTITIPDVSGDIVITAKATQTIPITWIAGTSCTYAVGSACTVSAGGSYSITEKIPVEVGKTYVFKFNATASSTFRFVGIDDNNIVTEAINNSYATGDNTFRYSPTSGTTSMRIRGYTNLYNAATEIIVE